MAMLQRWDPFRDVISLRSAVDRMLRESLVRPGSRTAADAPAAVALDVHESDNQFVVKASLPGIKPEDAEVLVRGNTLTIRGEHKADEEKTDKGYLIRERHYGAFHRSVTLPAPINADQAEARYENGVLVLTLPKAEEAQAKPIKVSAKAQLTGGQESGQSQAQSTEPALAEVQS